MTGVMCVMLGAGSDGTLALYNMTAGSASGYYGFDLGYFGSISPSAFSLSGTSSSILAVEWDASDGLVFRVAGDKSNSGWTSMEIDGVAYNRATATFSNSPGSWTRWAWTASNPFVNGNPYVVKFT